MTEAKPRALDHVVLSVPSLHEARAVFEALGFLVAPEARHPFGTANACVFFADGTYLEPLAIAEPEIADIEVERGNVFVAHDRAFRARQDVPGFSGLAFQSSDAEADHQRFVEAGLSAGEMLSFGRTARLPDGSEVELGFRLAFAADPRAPDCLAFACQPLHQRPLDRSSLTVHPNGVAGLSGIILSASDPSGFADVLHAVVGARQGAPGFPVEAENAWLDISTPDDLARSYGATTTEVPGLRVEGLVLRTADVDAIEARCRSGRMDCRTVGERLVVPLGPSAFLAFERASPAV